MARCNECTSTFDVAEARAEYQAEFDDELDYDRYVGGDLCGRCAVATAESNINRGRTLAMANGGDDYDDNYVTLYL